MDRLHPEGAPGISSQLMRSFMGDAQYEKMLERNETAEQDHRESLDHAADRYQAVTALIRLAGAMALVVLFALIATAPALVMWVWSLAR